jgi:hypothetical protein
MKLSDVEEATGEPAEIRTACGRREQCEREREGAARGTRPAAHVHRH